MFEEHYEVIDGIRLHYVDEGSGPPILLVHGQPTWSYLYRKMIQPLVAAGYRCIAPDLMGFGLSDKPTDESAYTLRRHVELVTGLVEKLQLEGVTIVGQDWGGPIGLRYAIDHQDNVKSLVILNTLVRTTPVPLPFTLVFWNGGFSSFLVRRLDLFRKMAFRRGWPFRRPLESGVMEQYKMPHPRAASRAGIAAFPKMIPGNDRHPNAAYISEIDSVLRTWDVPVLVMFSDRDIAFKPTEGQRIADMVPNGRFHVVRNAGHYLQEDAGEEIAQRMDHVPETRGQDYLTRDEVIPFKSKCPRRSYNSPRACRHPVWTGRRESYYRIRGPYSLRWLGAYSFALLGESRLE